MNVEHFKMSDATFFQFLDEAIFVGDVLDSSNSPSMSAGYYRNDKKGAKNEWVLTYDEVLVVLSGALTIRSDGEAKTAKPGEILFLKKGTKLAYEAGADNTVAVYVSFPHWLEAQQGSSHAQLLDSYRPAAQT